MEELRCTAFAGKEFILSGKLEEVALAVKARLLRQPDVAILIVEDGTGRVFDLDLRGSDAEAMARLEQHPLQAAARRPGRPRLGVVAREVTLLPRHWDWLNAQPGGASVALRKLVDEARRSNVARDRQRQAQEAAYRFASAMAGNEPGYEEAMRALFAGNKAGFDSLIATWPADVSTYARHLAADAFP